MTGASGGGADAQNQKKDPTLKAACSVQGVVKSFNTLKVITVSKALVAIYNSLIFSITDLSKGISCLQPSSTYPKYNKQVLRTGQ